MHLSDDHLLFNNITDVDEKIKLLFFFLNKSQF